MSTLRYALAIGAVMLVASPSANAQLRRTDPFRRTDPQTIPVGMCQVWTNDLPADRQQPPTIDCERARRNRSRNTSIIVGTGRPTNVYGNRDPRSIPGTPQYDPRFDPRSPQYDPRLDPHDNGRWERERSVREREEWRRKQERERLEIQRKQEREREKLLRKQEKEREKELRKAQKGKGRGHDDDDDSDRRRGGKNGTVARGPIQSVCVDANRDGICDNAQASGQPIPRPIPQTVPGGRTRRVCVDANRDGKCDDGGPLIRMTTP